MRPSPGRRTAPCKQCGNSVEVCVCNITAEFINSGFIYAPYIPLQFMPPIQFTASEDEVIRRYSHVLPVQTGSFLSMVYTDESFGA